jgi:hypothetical protein
MVAAHNILHASSNISISMNLKMAVPHTAADKGKAEKKDGNFHNTEN